MEKEILTQQEGMDIIAPDLKQRTPSTSSEFERMEGAEVVSMRGAYTKQFDLGENRYQAVTYPMPVHYRKAGKWEEIDNNLIEMEQGGRKVLRNKANALVCELAQEVADGPLVVLRNRQHTLSWAFEQTANPVQAEVVTGERLKRELLLRMAKEKPGNAQRNSDFYTDEELIRQQTPEARRSDVTEKSSQVLYKDILPGVTVRYTLSGDELKEDIICANRNALSSIGLKLPDSYRYVVDLDGRVSVRDESEAEWFFFDAPVVYDSVGLTTIGKVQLELCDGYYRLSYLVNEEFLAVAAYPVVIDPVTKVRPTDNIDWANVVYDTALDLKLSVVQRPTAPKALKKATSKETFMLMKLNALAQIKSSDTVISAKLKLAVTGSSGAGGKYIGVRGITANWNEQVAGSTFYDADHHKLINVTDIQDYAALGTSSVTLDLTNIYRDWYRVNNGFLIYMASGSGSVSFGAPNNGTVSKRPQFIVNYISHAGLESWWTYESQSAGRAGTTSVDLFNGNMVHAHQDSVMTGNRLPVSISHYYNSCQSATGSADRLAAEGSAKPADYNTLYRSGWGWRHSGLQYIYEPVIEKQYYYVWVDGDGTEHWFKRSTDKQNRAKKEQLYDVEGMGLKLTKIGVEGEIPEKIELEDRSHSVMTFRRRLTAKHKGTWNNWWLTSVRDSMRNSDNKLANLVQYSYEMPDPKGQDNNERMHALEGKLESITDPAGRTTEFSYYAEADYAGTQYANVSVRPGMGLLKEIRTPTGINGASVIVYFLYNANNRLTGILYSDLYETLAKPSNPAGKGIVQLLLDEDIKPHTRYVYEPNTNLLMTIVNYENSTVVVQYEQLPTNGSFFELPYEVTGEGEANENAESGPPIPSVANENMCRVICMESVKFNDAGNTALARGAKQVFNYRNCLTEVTNVESVNATAIEGKKIVYQFNDKGNLISIRDELGYAQFIKFESGQENAPSSVSNTQRAVVNRIQRPTLLNWDGILGAEWVRTVTSTVNADKDANICDVDIKTNRCLNCASMKMIRKQNGEIRFRQNLDLELDKEGNPKTWTLSAYVKANAIVPMVDNETQRFVAGDGAYMRIASVGVTPAWEFKSEAITGSTADAFGNELTADGWERLRMSFTPTVQTSTVSVVVEFVLGGASGTVYFAAPQLEEGLVANPVNLLSNGDFRLTDAEPSGGLNRTWASYWTAGKGVSKETPLASRPDASVAANLIGVFNPHRTQSSGTDPQDVYDPIPNTYDPFLDALSGNYLQLTSGMQRESQECWFTQALSITGKEKDVYYAGGWASAKAMPAISGNARAFQFLIQFYCNSKWVTGKGGTHNYNNEWVGWQMQSGAAVAPKDYSKVRVALVFKGQPLFAKFTNFYLFREEFGKSYVYDGKKNVVSATARSGQQAGMEYDSHNNLISYRKPGRDNEKENKYQLKYGNSDREKKQHLVRETRTPMGMISTTKYDKYGNTVESVAKAKSGNAFIKSTVGYATGDLDTQGNYAVMRTDALGKTATINVDPQTGLTLWARDPAGTKVYYNYDHLKRLKNVKCEPEPGKIYRNDYTYNDKGQMTALAHNTTGATSDVSYTFEYDDAGAQTAVKVAGHTLSQSVYNQDKRSHRLEESVFGNGGKVKNTYDPFDRVIGICYDDETTPRYKYAFGANGRTAYVTDTHLNRTHWTEYDQAGRPMQTTTWDGKFELSGSERGKLLYRTTLKYDKYNHLSLFGERIAGKDKAKPVTKKDKDGKEILVNEQPVYVRDMNGNLTYEPEDNDGTDNITTKYEYDRDDRITKITYDEKDAERSVQYKYDSLGRVSQVMVLNGGEVYPIDKDELTDEDQDGYTGQAHTVNYEYAPGGQGAGSASTRVTRMIHEGLSAELEYGYDDLGNITSEGCDLDGGKNYYLYDKLGQLLRASVLHDTECGPDGTTWVYTYDKGGNILKMEGYPRLTNIDGSLPETPTKTIQYAYDDTGWKDLLTSYDSKAIQYTPDTLPPMPDGMTYFHMGNPYRYDDWVYTWVAGRQLAKMEHMIPDGLDEQGHPKKKADPTLEFSYDAAGLRTQKKYTYTNASNQTVVVTTDYILHGKLLMHQKVTTRIDGVQQGAEPQQLHFYYDAISRPIMVRMGNEEATCQYYSYVYNLQGDILGIIDKNQNLVVEYRYDPWGKLLSTDGSMAGTLGKLNPFRYRGYTYDGETSLYYLRSRYYNPEWSRFINEDGSLAKSPRLLIYNIFVYCYNTPNRLTDSDGNFAIPSFLGLPYSEGDAVGLEIGFWWMEGRGSEFVVVNDEDGTNAWGQYLMDSPVCTGIGCDHSKRPESTLGTELMVLVDKYAKNVNLSAGETLAVTIDATDIKLQNGEQAYGYNFLHGASKDDKLGLNGLYMNVVYTGQGDGALSAHVSCQWDDYIDPNYKYTTDKRKSDEAKKYWWGSPTDYIIRICWDFYRTYGDKTR